MNGYDTTNLPDPNALDVGSEELCRSFDYTRPIEEYGTIDQIVTRLQDPTKPKHIYTKDLQGEGQAVADAMEKYLETQSYSSGMLKAALKSPLHLFYERESGWKEELRKFQKKPHFSLGTYLHQCILEPTKFKRAIVEPKHSLSTTNGVEALIKFWSELIRDMLPEEDYEIVHLAEEAVLDAGLSMTKIDGKKMYYRELKERSGLQAVSEEHKIIIDIVKYNYDRYGGGLLPRLVKHCKREISCYGEDPGTGLPVKCRPDALQFEENIGVNAILSIKSTSQEELDGFTRHAASLKYDLTEGYYQNVASRVTGRDFNTTITIMLQTVPPYGVAALVWRGEDLEAGKYKVRTALDIAAACEVNGYPGYDAFAENGNFGLIQHQLPDWIQREILPTAI